MYLLLLVLMLSQILFIPFSSLKFSFLEVKINEPTFFWVNIGQILIALAEFRQFITS